jgi:hypothetical protein
VKGFRVDVAEGGFILRELHPKLGKQDGKRKYGVAKTDEDVIRIIKKWLKYLK